MSCQHSERTPDASPLVVVVWWRPVEASELVPAYWAGMTEVGLAAQLEEKIQAEEPEDAEA